MIFRFLSFLLLLPSVVYSEVGFRDLKLGETVDVIEQNCQNNKGLIPTKLTKPYKGLYCYQKFDLRFEFTLDDTEQLIQTIEIDYGEVSPNTLTHSNPSNGTFTQLKDHFSQKYGVFKRCEPPNRKIEVFKNGTSKSISFYFGKGGEVQLFLLNFFNTKTLSVFYTQPLTDEYIESWCSYNKISKISDF